MAIQQFSNPRTFMRFADAVLPWAKAAMVAAFVAGLYMGLVVAPPDYQQGDAARIMFVHVPAASLSMAIYGAMAAASITAMIWGHRVADLFAKSLAPIGAGFTFLALFTGSFWGKPMWGAWWVWDARVTSEFVLLFMYFGYIGLWQAIEEPVKAAKAARILAIVGVVNLPIIKFSVDWWNTMHQPASVMKLDGPAIDPSLLWPLMVMTLAFGLFITVVSLMRTQSEILSLRAYMRKLRLVSGAEGGV